MDSSRLRVLQKFGLSLTAALSLAVAPAHARLNLPQMRQALKLDDAAQSALRAYFSETKAAGQLPTSVQKTLIESLPQDVRDACGDLISNWGDIARGSEEWSVRALRVQPGRAWLAFRCSSRVLDYRDFYDERPALVRLAAGTMQFFPLDPDAGNDSTLYHLEFVEVAQLPGAEGAVLRVLVPGQNPCCDGGDQITEERLVVFADTAAGAFEAGSFVTLKDLYSHDDTDGDAELIYKAVVEFERNREGLVVGATARFTDDNFDMVYEGGKSEKRLAKKQAGTLHYRWNPAVHKFEEIPQAAPR